MSNALKKLSMIKKALSNEANLTDFVKSVLPVDGVLNVDLTKIDPLLGSLLPKDCRKGKFQFKLCSVQNGEWLAFLIKEVEQTTGK